MLQLLFTQTLLLAAHIEEKKVIKSTFEQLNFLLCGSCYCCASSISLRDIVEICPSCMNGKEKSMLINSFFVMQCMSYIRIQNKSMSYKVSYCIIVSPQI